MIKEILFEVNKNKIFKVYLDCHILEFIDFLVMEKDKYLNKSEKDFWSILKENNWISMQQIKDVDNPYFYTWEYHLALCFPCQENINTFDYLVLRKKKQESYLFKLNDFSNSDSKISYSLCWDFLSKLNFRMVLVEFSDLPGHMQLLCSQGGDEDYACIFNKNLYFSKERDYFPNIIKNHSFDSCSDPRFIDCFGDYIIAIGSH